MLSDLDELPTVQLGDFTLEIEMNDLTPEMQEVARKELRETPDVKRDAIVALRDLLKGEWFLALPSLHGPWTVVDSSCRREGIKGAIG